MFSLNFSDITIYYQFAEELLSGGSHDEMVDDGRLNIILFISSMLETLKNRKIYPDNDQFLRVL